MTIIEKKVVMVSVLRFVWKSVLPGHDAIDACGWYDLKKLQKLEIMEGHQKLLKYIKSYEIYILFRKWEGGDETGLVSIFMYQNSDVNYMYLQVLHILQFKVRFDSFPFV